MSLDNFLSCLLIPKRKDISGWSNPNFDPGGVKINYEGWNDDRYYSDPKKIYEQCT